MYPILSLRGGDSREPTYIKHSAGSFLLHFSPDDRGPNVASSPGRAHSTIEAPALHIPSIYQLSHAPPSDSSGNRCASCSLLCPTCLHPCRSIGSRPPGAPLTFSLTRAHSDCSPPAPSPPPANLARSRRSNSDAHRASVFVQPATAAGVNLPLPGTAEACYVPPRVSVYVPGNGADARRANGANVYVDTERGTACRAVSRRTRGNPWEPAGGGLRRTSHCTVRNMAPDGFVSCYVLTRLPPSYVSLSAAYVPCT